MHPFDATEHRIDTTCARFPAFPREPAILVRLVKHIARSVHDTANVVLREHELNHTDYNILMMLYGSREAAISPSQLAAAAGEKSANITRVCNMLCERQLIYRAPSAEDRRKVALSLTARGKALVERLLPAMSDLLNECTRGLKPDEQTRLEGLLKKLLASTEQVRDIP